MPEADRTPRARRHVSARGPAHLSGLYDARNPSGHAHAQAQPGYQAQAGAHQGASGQGHDSQRGLRTMDSRFSLNEHFAASRVEYQFDDDASSVFGGPAASIVPGAAEAEVPGDEGPGDEDEGGGSGLKDGADFYEVLCVGREGLTREEVRRAYFRWFELLYPLSHGEDVARVYFGRVQEAFETLVDEERRAEYDASLAGTPSPQKNGPRVISDLGVRIDASAGGKGVKPVDFLLGHSASVGVPSLGRVVENEIRRIQALMARTKMGREAGDGSEKALQQAGMTTFVVPSPTVTVSGYAYGVAEGVPPATLTEQHPPLLRTVTRPRTRLLRNLDPLVAVTLRQDLLTNAPSGRTLAASSLEVESNLLPLPTVTTRASHSALVRGSPTSLGVGLASSRISRPQVCLAAARAVGDGAVFARVDSGNWRARMDETCRYFTEFTRMSGRLSREVLGPQAASFEVGYTKGVPCETGAGAVLHEGTLGLLRGERAAMDSVRASWSVALRGTADYVSSSLRYTADVPAATPTRVEVEFCTGPSQPHMAVRNLFAVGSSSHLGVELSLSSQALHLSLALSHLDQRFSLPVYIRPSPRALFLAAAVPLLVSAGMSLFSWPKQRAAAERRKEEAEGGGEASDKRREEADSLTFLLHRSLTRQTDTTRPDDDGVAILSAKYGAAEDEFAGEHVADVTVALSALVRDGKLDVPGGLRTSRLPGFWDPAPGREKVLRVDFRVGGRDGVVEAKEGEGLRIP